MRQIILASGSPRRKALLKKCGIKFTVVESNTMEYFDPKLKPQELVEKLSLEKAKLVYKKYSESIIIAADTIVECDGKILGKPKDKKDARQMLEFLSGKTHSIFTGFAIIDDNKVITKSQETKIYMKMLKKSDIDDYLNTEEPYDKAGAYAIQEKGNALIEKIEGDFDSAVGLPINTLLVELKKLGVKIP